MIWNNIIILECNTRTRTYQVHNFLACSRQIQLTFVLSSYFNRSSEEKLEMTLYLVTLSLGVAVLMTSLPGPALSCSVVNWQEMSFPQQVVAAGIAVHARVVDKLKGTGLRVYADWPRVYRAVLQVHCVFKGGPLPANLTVDLMGQLDTCLDTRVEIGEDYILLLKRGDDMYLQDMYLPDEVNHDSAAIPADQDHLDQVSRTCDLGDFTSPANTSAQLGCSVSWDGAGADCLGAAAAGSVNRGSFGLTTWLLVFACCVLCVMCVFFVCVSKVCKPDEGSESQDRGSSEPTIYYNPL
ncbi:uncharacterized protein LOC144921472 [Branchiostoma floridae x Branchiostoma belcheri]